MASRGFHFTASTSEDVVAYRVTLAKNGAAVGSKDYADEDIPHATDAAKRTVNLANDPDWPALDGTYEVRVLAIDDAGNPSLVPLGGSLTLDFVPPESPTGFEPF